MKPPENNLEDSLSVDEREWIAADGVLNKGDIRTVRCELSELTTGS